MIRRTIRGLIQLLGGLAAGLAIAMVLLAWRLSSGPISLAFLTPYVEEALNESGRPLAIRLDDTILTWAGWQRTLDIRVLGARAVRADGHAVAEVPEVSLSLSGRAMVHGVLAPSSVELIGPRLDLVRRSDGGWQLGSGTDAIPFGEGRSGGLPLWLLDDLRMAPDPARPVSFLIRVSVLNARLNVADHISGRSWTVAAESAAVRRDAAGLRGEADVVLALAGGQPRFSLLADYGFASHELNVGARFDNLRPSEFASLRPELAAIDVPFHGNVSLTASAEGRLHDVGFDLSAGAGVVTLPAPLAQQLHVSRGSARGLWEAAQGRLDVPELSLAFPEGSSLRLPPADHPMPLRAAEAQLAWFPAAGRLEVPRLWLDLAGPTAQANLGADGIGGETTLRAAGALSGTPIDQLATYWPKGWGDDARNWCVPNMSVGTVTEARAQVALRLGKDGVKVESLSGDMDIAGATVDYLAPMPKATGANGRATFDTKSFDIHIAEGRRGDLLVRPSRVLFTGLDEVDQYTDIHLVVDGPLKSALQLVDHKPFGYASALGLQPAGVSGNARTVLDLRFMLAKDLSREKVKVAAAAELAEVAVPRIVHGLDLSQGSLTLKVDNDGMDVLGEALLGTIPASVSWRENFRPDRKYRRRYHVRGKVDDAQRTRELGLDFAPFTTEFMRGEADAELRLTETDAHDSQLQARLDLKDVELDLAALGWTKAAGQGGWATVGVEFVDDRIRAVPAFKVRAGDMAIDGSARFTKTAGSLESLTFDRFAYGRTDLSALLVPQAGGGWDADLKGASFDMEPVLRALVDGEEVREDDGAKEEKLPRVTVSANVKSVRLGGERQLTRVAGAMAWDGRRWESIRLQGKVGEDKEISLAVTPAEGKRTLHLASDDAGATLRVFDLYDNMLGGRLEISGEFHDKFADSPLAGTLRVEDFRVVKAPTLAYVVTYLSLTGLLEALEKGQGLRFTELEAPFMMRGGVIEIKEARSTGLSLGVTASGKVYTHADVMEIEGTVVPAYAINSALGHLPVLGSLFTGGEKGGGIFAATYSATGPIERPEVSVNPLTALAPGFLRKLFNIFEPDRQKADAGTGGETASQADGPLNGRNGETFATGQ